jgi:hypothetical protein
VKTKFRSTSGSTISRLIAVAAAALASGACHRRAPLPPPTAEVVVARVVQQDVPIYSELPREHRGDRDDVIGVRCVTHPEKEAERDDRGESVHERDDRG